MGAVGWLSPAALRAVTVMNTVAPAGRLGMTTSASCVSTEASCAPPATFVTTNRYPSARRESSQWRNSVCARCTRSGGDVFGNFRRARTAGHFKAECEPARVGIVEQLPEFREQTRGALPPGGGAVLKIGLRVARIRVALVAGGLRGADGLRGAFTRGGGAGNAVDIGDFARRIAAEIYKAYLVGACRIIRKNSGEITAFDGDRVMAVFIGDYKNTSAAKAALNINGFVGELNALIKQSYPKTGYVLRQSVGIDTSNLFVARTGIRNSNDLVWVGRAANYAAKLCALGDATYPSHITEEVFSKLNEEVKYDGSQPRKPMWEKLMWNEMGIVIYRSSWWWKF
jgi:hypothetical protein